MSDATSGQAGKVTIGSEITEITNWSIDRPIDALETSSMTSGGNREFKAGMKGWKGSFETVKYNSIGSTGTVAVGSFQTAASATTSQPTYSGTIVLTNAPIAVPYDGIVKWAHTFQGSGPLTITTS